MSVDSPRRFRLLVLATHPIQYRAPLYRRLAGEDWLDLEVWYGDDYGVRPTASLWGVRDFRWDTDLVSGYRHRFFRNAAWRPGPVRSTGIYNPGLGREIARAAPDAVWISGYATLHSWQALLGAWRARIPVLYASDSNALGAVGGQAGGEARGGGEDLPADRRLPRVREHERGALRGVRRPGEQAVPGPVGGR